MPYVLTEQGKKHLAELEKRIPKKTRIAIETAIIDSMLEKMTWLERQEYLLVHPGYKGKY